jgi:hypothetical protein
MPPKSHYWRYPQQKYQALTGIEAWSSLNYCCSVNFETTQFMYPHPDKMVMWILFLKILAFFSEELVVSSEESMRDI